MKIGINALFFQFQATGSGQYLSHLLNALAEIDHHNQYILLGPQPIQSLPVTAYPYHVHPVPALTAKSDNLAKVVWEQFTGPLAARQEKVDLLHIPYFAPPLFLPMPTVVTIHDVIAMRLPAYQPNSKVKAYTNLIARTAHHASRIIAPSMHARQDIIDLLKIPSERIHVIYEAAGPEYQPITDPDTLAKARARYGLGKRYIFYLGGLDQRKNIPQLVRAFARLYKQIEDPNLQLLIAGNPDKHKGPLFPDPRPVAKELGISEQIIYSYIEEEDKPTLYSATSLFVFPSLYEGFGLDPLEAMGCGAPVVCSNRTSLPEVVGDAALSVDPDNLEALVEAMYRVLTNTELQADLRARSLQQAKRFNWHQTAEQTLAVYEEVLASKKK
jgi:glycosyltransferase involved in cell wall biosynthesis